MDSIFRKILPDVVYVEEIDPVRVGWDETLLFSKERHFVRNAVDKRRREFLAGRLMARSVMARMGLPKMEIAPGPDRAPVWPAGITGSISHTNAWCAAAVARTSDVMSLGIDVETATPLPDELFSIVLSQREKIHLQNSRLGKKDVLAKLIFSAKETAYKAQYSITRTFLDFEAMTVELDEDGRSWRALFNPGCRPRTFPTDTIRGQWHHEGSLIATSAVLLS